MKTFFFNLKSKLKSKISNLYWRFVRYSAEGLETMPGLRDNFLTNARVFALVIGLDLEPQE